MCADMMRLREYTPVGDIFGKTARRDYGRGAPSLWRSPGHSSGMAIPLPHGYLATMSPAQCRAARGLLNWSEDRLASTAGITISVVRDFEAEKSVPRSIAQALQRALEAAGIEFSDHGAPGVRQQPAPAVLRLDELNASNDD
jgi:hypothetical protein